MNTELQKSTPERFQKKKSSHRSSQKSKTVLPACLMPLPSSSSDVSDDDDEESPRKEFLTSYSPKSKIRSDVPVKKLAAEAHDENSDTYFKSPHVEKHATKRKGKELSKRVSSTIKQEMSPLNLNTLYRANSSEESSGSPRKKSRSKKKMAVIDDSIRLLSSDMPTLPSLQQSMTADRLTHGDGGSRQVDAYEQFGDSSDSSSLTDSMSEGESFLTAVEGQRVSQDGSFVTVHLPEGEPTDDENTGETRKQMRFKAPEPYKECKLQSKELNAEDAKDSELWLIKVPLDFDVADMDKKSVSIGGAVLMNKTTDKDGVQHMWEMEASHDDTLEGSNWCVMLPSKKDNKLCPVGPFKGQICVTKSVQRLPYVIPPVPTKHVAMPEGLKMRNVPFGADAPLRKKSKKHRESYHRDDENVKKHKRKRHLEDSESTDVVVKDEQVDWVTVKHRKKHKIHKRHSIKER